MVRQLHMEIDDEVFENSHPRCIWGVFHALSYNLWHKNVKKMLPYSTKHNQTKYSKGSARPRTRLIAYDSDEVDSLLDVETSRIHVNTSTKKTSSTSKKSLRTRIKSLISEEPLKKEKHRRKPRFQRTYSIHHLECSDYVTRISPKSDSGAKPLKNQGYFGTFNKSARGHVSEKYEKEAETSVDVLEIYGVNKDMFAKVMKNTEGGIPKSFFNSEIRKDRLNLTRSGSYPSPKLSQIKNLKPIKLDHKQNENWCHSKVDTFFADLKPQVVDGTKKHRRRTLSLNDTLLEKYAQLLPKSSIGEPKLSSSKSLRLTSDCSSKRVQSLSRVDSYVVFQNELSCDSYSSVLVVKPTSDSNINIEHVSNEKTEDITNLVESIGDDESAELPKVSKEIEEKIAVLKDSEEEEEIGLVEVSDNKISRLSSFSVVQNNFEEDAMRPTDFLASEDSDSENNSDDKESSGTTSNEEFYDIEDENELHKRSYNDFDYVSDILDGSGFNGNDLFAPWYSLDQPLNPLIFDEVETYWPHEDMCPKGEVCCHHQILFDLTNELLVQMYDTSFTYYPRALSSNCHVPSMPAKFSALNVVWDKISKIMNSNLKLNQTVDGILAQDMWSNDDRWMNLQLESEYMALDLEDMFFDEILEEIIC